MVLGGGRKRLDSLGRYKRVKEPCGNSKKRERKRKENTEAAIQCEGEH